MTEPASPAARDALIAEHDWLARSLARRFSGRGETSEDLTQVAMLGLVAAANRFDPECGVRFPAFAAPTILGELRRHFRDRAWHLKVPRGDKEDYLQVASMTDSLTNTTGRPPTVQDLAEATGFDEERVIDAILAGRSYRTDAIVESPQDDQPGTVVESAFGGPDPGFDQAEMRIETQRALEVLDGRERRIVEMRFEQGLSQAEIGRRVGLSQVHVSRLLRDSLRRLRERMDP